MENHKSQGRIAKMAAKGAQLSQYLKAHPGVKEETLLNDLQISKATLYVILAEMADNQDICVHNEFQILNKGKRLTLRSINAYLEKNKKDKGDKPGPAERMIYLYHLLHEAIPTGGIAFQNIKFRYQEKGFNPPQEKSLNKMIYRDLAQLQNMGIGIESSGDPKTYYLAKTYIPSLGPDSTAALYATTLLYRGTLLDEATQSAARQIEQSMQKSKLIDPTILKERIHVVSDTLANPEQFNKLFGKLVLSILNTHQIRLEYTSNSGHQSKPILEPLGLLCKRGVWYLIAKTAELGQMRVYRVDQVSDVIKYERNKFVYPQDFSMDQFLGDSWGVYCDDKVQTVKLKFSPRVARRVKNLHYHPSQRIIDEDNDGSLTVEFKTCGLIELQTWLLQWGDEVEVLSPVGLKKRIIASAQAIVDKYK